MYPMLSSVIAYILFISELEPRGGREVEFSLTLPELQYAEMLS